MLTILTLAEISVSWLAAYQYRYINSQRLDALYFAVSGRIETAIRRRSPDSASEIYG